MTQFKTNKYQLHKKKKKPSKLKKYCFIVGAYKIQIKSKSEQLALKKLVLSEWEIIEKYKSIKLLGEVDTIYK